MKKWLSLLLTMVPWTVQAQLVPEAPAGPSLADSGSAYYRFERFELDSVDGHRHYRIDLAIPRQPAPARGYPLVVLLDGNAVLADLREEWLAELGRFGPPLLVMVGYVGEQRFDVLARTFDYTPALVPGEALQEDEVRRRQAGGAALFREWLITRVLPEVAGRYPLDPQRYTLWGHSYGGLFVLDTLFCNCSPFQRFAAASPSLWWQSGMPLTQADDYAVRSARQPARLLLTQGSEELKPRERDPSNALALARAQARASVPPAAGKNLVANLDQLPEVQAGYLLLPGAGHGPALTASLLPALRFAIGEGP